MASHTGLEILFFPFPSPGHYLPLLDIAVLLASRGATATFVVNPVMHSRLSPSLRVPGLRLQTIPFPSAASGLPDGVCTVDAVPAVLSSRFAIALSLLCDPFSNLIFRLNPDAVISDALLPWTATAAASFSIPWYSFPGTGLFALSVDRSILLNRPQRTGSCPFVVPNLPNLVELTHARLKETTLPGEMTHEFFELGRQADRFTTGIIVNSFADLEPGYCEHYERETGKQVYSIGPVSLTGCHDGQKDRRIMDWLDKKLPRSVIYVCFGSLCRVPPKQLAEIRRGLEDSGVVFLWVIRSVPETEGIKDDEVTRVEEMVRGRGMVVRGWVACQATVLRHPAVGGFLSHCGWGAVTEAVAAGVPILTWPMFAEQFYNEKLVTEVIGIGIEVGVEEGFVWGEEERVGILVGWEKISERVRWLMANIGGEEVGEIRKRAKEMGEKARRAVAEGGSSYSAVESLLQEIQLRSTYI